MGNAHLLSYFDVTLAIVYLVNTKIRLQKLVSRTVYAFCKKEGAEENPQTGFLLTTQDNKLFTKVGDLGDEITIDDENKTGIINTVRHTYVPIHSKVLLK